MSLAAAFCIISGVVIFFVGGLVLYFHPRAQLNQIIALMAFDYGVWAFCSGLEVPEIGSLSAESRWTTLRVALVASTFPPALGLAFALVLAGFKGGKLWWWLSVPLVVAVVQAYQAWTGAWVIAGYKSGPFGATLELNTGSLWPWFNVVVVNILWVLSLVILAWAWKTHAEKRYRSLVALTMSIGLLVNGLGVACLVLWLAFGFPNFSLVAMGGGLLGLCWLVVRRGYLKDGLWQTSEYFQRTSGLITLVDPRGLVVRVSPALVRAFHSSEDDLKGRDIVALLPGWSGLRARWGSLVAADGSLPGGLPGTLGAGQYTLTLTRQQDRFGDVMGFVVSLIPKGPVEQIATDYHLSLRERDVALELFEGRSLEEIAEHLFISVSTVRNHLHNLFQKTRTSNRSDLVRFLHDPRPTKAEQR